MSNLIKEWKRDPNKHKADSSGKYAIMSISPHFSYVTTMLCRIFGNKYVTQFPLDWVPLIHKASDGLSYHKEKKYT